MMRLMHWRFAMGVMWAGLAVALFFREDLLPADVLQRRAGSLGFATWMALLLAGWNLARWYQIESARKYNARLEKLPRPRPAAEPAKYEYNSEFDFQKMDRPAGTPPGANGDGH